MIITSDPPTKETSKFREDAAANLARLNASRAADIPPRAGVNGGWSHEHMTVFAMLAHELRNPLACVINAAQVLHTVEVQEGDGQRKWAVASIERHAQRISWILDDVLGLSEAENSKAGFRSTLLDAAKIMEDAQESVRAPMAAHGHTLTVEVPSDALWLCGDAGQLEQVLVNLLTNAARYTNAGGRIVLRGSREGADVVIRVSDNGIGIAEELLDSVFTPFLRGDTARALAGDGLGIGLTVVRLLVERHKGTVTVFSEGVGRGSTFVVRLPAAVPGCSEVGSSGSGASKLSTFRILIVDDNCDLTRGLSHMLRLCGHVVQCASTGAAALELASAFQPEFVLVDVSLPDLTGYEVASLLQGASRAEGGRIVSMSGYGGSEERSLSQAAGCICHLQKPVDVAEINALLTGQCANLD
ncbi:hybrid sensor histidine kinase/response regulator [Verrucomicrobiota bacterium sgz303538]